MRAFPWVAILIWPLATAAAQPLEFDAVSIKPHTGEVTVSGLGISGTRIEETAVSLMDLVTGAYNLRYEQVSGGPEWGKGGARFDIVAKAPGEREPSREQIRQMLQSMLADSFKLTVRRETADTPVYALEPAKGGAKLKPSDQRVGVKGWGTDMGRHMEGSVNMEFLSRQLALSTGRQVVDRTGLTGNYEMVLEWTPDGFTPVNNAESLSIFTAVQEQLGLKLEPARAPVERLIIEHAEKPDSN